MPIDQHVKRAWVTALVEARRLLVRGLRQLSHDDFKLSGTVGACPVAALLLHATLLKHSVKSEPRIKKGFYNQNTWIPSEHYWVQVTGEDLTVWNLDISADQFGDVRLSLSPDYADSNHTPYQQIVDSRDENSRFWKDMKLIDEGDPTPSLRIQRIVDLYFLNPATGLNRNHCISHSH